MKKKAKPNKIGQWRKGKGFVIGEEKGTRVEWNGKKLRVFKNGKEIMFDLTAKEIINKIKVGKEKNKEEKNGNRKKQ